MLRRAAAAVVRAYLAAQPSIGCVLRDVARAAYPPLRSHAGFRLLPRSRRQQPTLPAEADGSYAAWVLKFDTLTDSDRVAIRAHIACLSSRPLISIVMLVSNPLPQFLRQTIESVHAQRYPYWELCITDTSVANLHVAEILDFYACDPRVKIVRSTDQDDVGDLINKALSLAKGNFVAFLEHDSLLAEHALYEMAAQITAYPDVDVIFSDEDKVDEEGHRREHYFKPCWDPELLLSHNILQGLGVFRHSLLERLGGMRNSFESATYYDLSLRVADATTTDRIRHIPAVLYHRRQVPEMASVSGSFPETAGIEVQRAIAGHLLRRGVPARLGPAPSAPSRIRVIHAIPEPRPLVSVIVPTRDRPDLLACCADAVLSRTDYAPLELIIIDNDSREKATAAMFRNLGADSRVRILRRPGTFNYAAINNSAAAEARGEVLLFLNNDIDVIAPGWLEEMVSHAVRPEIGAVGAKLLYPDGRVQHAGVVLGAGGDPCVGGVASHFCLNAGRQDAGYGGHLALTRSVSAVTGACLMLRRSIFIEIGGFDSNNLPIAFNDVDLCLRIGSRGYRIVWTPFAELYHLESASRGSDMEPKRLARFARECAHMKSTWGSLLENDPFYNPNFSLQDGNCNLAYPPRRQRPWIDMTTRSMDMPQVVPPVVV